MQIITEIYAKLKQPNYIAEKGNIIVLAHEKTLSMPMVVAKQS